MKKSTSDLIWLSGDTAFFCNGNYMPGVEINWLGWAEKSQAQVFLRQTAPQAAKYLFSIKDGDILELMHIECGEASNYDFHTRIMRLSNIWIKETSSEDICQINPEWNKPILFQVKVVGSLDLWQI